MLYLLTQLKLPTLAPDRVLFVEQSMLHLLVGTAARALLCGALTMLHGRL